MKVVKINNPRGFGGRQGFPSTPPIWDPITQSSFTMTVFDPFSYTTTIAHYSNAPISNVQVKPGSGNLPTWITLSFSGNNTTVCTVSLSGTPNNLSYIGTYNFTLIAVNKWGTSEHTFTIIVNDGAIPVWNSNTLSNTSVTVFYPFSGSSSVTLPIKGPLTSVTSTGTFPSSWASITYSGTLVTVSGTPNAVPGSLGTYSFNLVANNKYGSASQSFNITVNNGAIPSWTTSSLPNGSVSVAYSKTANVTVPSDGPLTSVTTIVGSLPSWAGLTFNPSTGVITISGTPNSSSTASFTLRATNRYGHTDQALSITVTNPNESVLVYIGNNSSTSLFTATFTVPSGISILNSIEVIGGGAGGGDRSSGGAGAYSASTHVAVSPGQVFNITAGYSGIPGIAYQSGASPGGASSIICSSAGVNISAPGGVVPGGSTPGNIGSGGNYCNYKSGNAGGSGSTWTNTACGVGSAYGNGTNAAQTPGEWWAGAGGGVGSCFSFGNLVSGYASGASSMTSSGSAAGGIGVGYGGNGGSASPHAAGSAGGVPTFTATQTFNGTLANAHGTGGNGDGSGPWPGAGGGGGGGFGGAGGATSDWTNTHPTGGSGGPGAVIIRYTS